MQNYKYRSPFYQNQEFDAWNIREFFKMKKPVKTQADHFIVQPPSITRWRQFHRRVHGGKLIFERKSEQRHPVTCNSSIEQYEDNFMTNTILTTKKQKKIHHKANQKRYKSIQFPTKKKKQMPIQDAKTFIHSLQSTILDKPSIDDQQKVNNGKQQESFIIESNLFEEANQQQNNKQDPIQRIIQMAIEKGILAYDDNNYILVCNNIEYYLHLLNLCRCSYCTCGKCRCYHPRYKFQNMSNNQEEEKVENHNNVQISREFQDNLLLPKVGYGFRTTYQSDFKSFSIETPKKQESRERVRIPFLGQSSYKQNFINWSNYEESQNYKRPQIQHTGGDFKSDNKSNYQSAYTQLEKSQIPQVSAFEVKQIQNHQTLIPLYPNQKTSKYQDEFVKKSLEFRNTKQLNQTDYNWAKKMPSFQTKTTNQDGHPYLLQQNCPVRDFSKLLHDPALLAKMALELYDESKNELKL